MRRTAFLLVAVVVLAIVPLCLAVVEMPPDSNGIKQEIPTTFLQREGRDWFVWVAYQGYRPKSRWSEDAPPAGIRTLEFMESFHVLHRHEGGNGDYLLLGKADPTGRAVEQVVGWVRRDCTLGAEAERIPRVGFHQKVLVVTTAEWLKRHKKRPANEDIAILDAPSKDATKRAGGRMFNVFFVYGRTEQGEYGVAEEDYVLVGAAPAFRPSGTKEGSPASVIKGWVPARRIVSWNTRQAVEWDRSSTLAGANPRRTEPGRVFASAKDAKDFLDGVAGVDEIALFRERFDDKGQSMPFTPHQMRPPILEWDPDDLRVFGPAEEPPTYVRREYRSNELLKIGCIGRFGGLSQRDVAELRRRIRMLEESLREKGLDREAAYISRLMSGHADDFTSDVGAKYKAILENAGIDVENFSTMAGVQIFREGFVWRYAPRIEGRVPQVRVKVLMDSATIERIIRCMEGLIDEREHLMERRARAAIALLVELAAALMGEAPDRNRSLKDLLSLERLLLVDWLPPVIEPMGTEFSPKLAYSEIIEIAHRRDLLRDILAGKQRTWEKQEVTLADETVHRYVAIGEAKDHRRCFSILGSAVKWYWIDLEDELP